MIRQKQNKKNANPTFSMSLPIADFSMPLPIADFYFKSTKESLPNFASNIK